MNIILLCVFTFIFYTMLTEFSSENTVSSSKINQDYKNLPEVNLSKFSSPQKPITKPPVIVESVIDEALNFDKNVNSLGGAQNSLEEALLSSLADRQLSLEEEAEYKKHFIREYINQAKQAGYDIKLNDQLQVISITPKKTYGPILIEEDE